MKSKKPDSDIVTRSGDKPTSSSSGGKPTVVGYTREDIDTWAGLVARSIRAAGGRPGDIHVEHAPDAAASRREAATRELAHLVKSHVGVSVRVELHAPGALERSSGKARRVIDRRSLP